MSRPTLGIGFPLGAARAASPSRRSLGFVTGVSALRVRGVSLAVVTLAAAVAIEQFGFANSDVGRGGRAVRRSRSRRSSASTSARARRSAGSTAAPEPRARLLLLAVVVLPCLFVARLRRSGLGQRMLAVRSNERAAAAAGVSVRNTKFAAFGISSFIAGVGGVLYAYASAR